MYGLIGQPEYIRHFIAGKTIFLYQLEDQLAPGRQLVDGLLDGPPQLIGDHYLFRVRAKIKMGDSQVVQVGQLPPYILAKVVRSGILDRYIQVDIEIIDGIQDITPMQKQTEKA